jgi:hypothetical protein
MIALLIRFINRCYAHKKFLQGQSQRTHLETPTYSLLKYNFEFIYLLNSTL